MSRILIVGAGAVGGYFGARLAQAGRDVTFLVRHPRAAILREHGLRIHTPDGTIERIDAKTVTADAVDAAYDLVLLAVKGYALDAAIRDITPAIGPATIIVPVLNGITHIAALADQFGADHVYGGVCIVATALDAQGDIVQLNQLQKLSWGPLDGRSADRLDDVSALLTWAGFDAEPSTTILHDMWEKWVFLASLGAITCLMRGTIGDVNAAPRGRDFALDILGEAADVAAAAGFAPREPFLSDIRRTVTEPRSALTSSMYRDLIASRPVEGDHILGALVDEGARHRVPTPLLALAHTSLSVYTAQRDSRRPMG